MRVSVVDGAQGEGRVGNPKLANHGAAAEARKCRRGLHRQGVGSIVVQDLKHGLEGIGGDRIVVEGGRRVGAAEEGVRVVAALGEWERVGGSVAAAELVLALGSGRGGGGVEAVEHEVAEGFAGDFATLHHHVDVQHKFSLRHVFSQHEENYAYYAP